MSTFPLSVCNFANSQCFLPRIVWICNWRLSSLNVLSLCKCPSKCFFFLHHHQLLQYSFNKRCVKVKVMRYCPIWKYTKNAKNAEIMPNMYIYAHTFENTIKKYEKLYFMLCQECTWCLMSNKLFRLFLYNVFNFLSVTYALHVSTTNWRRITRVTGVTTLK